VSTYVVDQENYERYDRYEASYNERHHGKRPQRCFLVAAASHGAQLAGGNVVMVRHVEDVPDHVRAKPSSWSITRAR
jgi:hypothetical protein